MNEPAQTSTIQQKLLVTRIIGFALINGVVLFLAVTFFIDKPASVAPTGTVTLFTGIAALLWVTMLVAGRLLYARQLSPSALSPLIENRNEDDALHIVHPRLQAACIIRWATLEGPAMFACVALFIYHGSLKAQPILWINVAIVVLSVAMIALSIPSEDSLRELIRTTRLSGSRPHR